MIKRFGICAIALLALALHVSIRSVHAQQPPAGPPPSIANEPPPEPGADDLNTAARKGDVAAVKALLDKGISPDAKWRYGMTALFPACDRGHLAVVKLLLDRGANVNVADRFYNQSPIGVALNKDHVEIAALLLEKGAQNSEQVLTAGIEKGHMGLIRSSLAKGGLQPYALTAALLKSTQAGKTEIAELLRSNGAQSAFAVNADLLKTYAGTYKAASGTVLVFTVKDGALEGGPTGQTLHLFATDEVTFRPLEFAFVVVKFAKDGSELSVQQGTQPTVYKREVSQ